MPLLALGLVVLVLLIAIALTPLALLQRYRAGTMRRRGRRWIATLNIVTLAISAAMLLSSAAATSLWVPWTLTYTAAGLGSGAILGVVGLALTRWEPGAQAVYYTPNRWLVLGVTLIVAARVLWGFVRGWLTWRAGVEGAPLLVAAGVAGTMAAGAVVVGYYLLFWVGVRSRVKRLERR